MFLAVDEGIYVVWSQFDAVAVSNGVGGAGVNAVAAENASRVVDVVDASIAFTGGDAIGFGIFGGFDVNTIRGARGCAKKTADALLEAVLIALKNVNAAIACRDAGRNFGIAFGGGFAKHRAQGDAEALTERRECFADFANYRSHRRNTLARISQRAKSERQANILQSVLRQPAVQHEPARNKAPARNRNKSMVLNQLKNIAVHHKSKNAQKEHKSNLNEPLLYRYTEITAQNPFDCEH